MKNRVIFERSSGNVFADLDLENASELLKKADLAHAINRELRSHAWTRSEAAVHTGFTESEVAELGRMRTDGFSEERLRNALRRLT